MEQNTNRNFDGPDYLVRALKTELSFFLEEASPTELWVMREALMNRSAYARPGVPILQAFAELLDLNEAATFIAVEPEISDRVKGFVIELRKSGDRRSYSYVDEHGAELFVCSAKGRTEGSASAEDEQGGRVNA